MYKMSEAVRLKVRFESVTGGVKSDSYGPGVAPKADYAVISGLNRTLEGVFGEQFDAARVGHLVKGDRVLGVTSALGVIEKLNEVGHILDGKSLVPSRFVIDLPDAKLDSAVPQPQGFAPAAE